MHINCFLCFIDRTLNKKFKRKKSTFFKSELLNSRYTGATNDNVKPHLILGKTKDDTDGLISFFFSTNLWESKFY